jgi:hypothetical protein
LQEFRLSNQTDLQNALNLKAPSTNIPASSITGLAVVATSGSYNDLLNKPTIPNAQLNSDWTATTGISFILNKPSLAVVATSGSYSDLSNKPTYSDVGAAPSTGISPSAISGTAVITTDSRLSDSRFPNGSATGDLSGSYPSPSVAKLQGYSVSATSPSIGQILQWGGNSWLPAAVPNGGSGGGGLVYFLNYGNTTGISPTTGLPTTPVPPSQLGRTYSVGLGSVTSGALTNGSYQFVCGFVSIVGEPNITTIPAGLWDFNIWASVSSASGNETQFQVRVFKYNSTTGIYTSLANSDDIYLYDPANISQYIANVTMPQTTILTTDRIYIELWAQKNVSGPRTITFHFDSLYPSHCHTTIPSVSGTGVVKVVNSVFQTPANLIFDADVDSAAAIAQSKIANLTTDLAGKAPSTGISPSAISGTAVITTDARLSDSRTPTAHASSHAVGGSDPLTASAIAALGLSTGACIIAKSGDDLLAKYAAAKLLTPNGAAISAQNRATLIILAGTYSLSADWQIDTDGVDVIALGATSFYPSAFIEINGHQIGVSCNNIRIVGIGVEESLLITSSNVDNCIGVVFEKCFSAAASFNAPNGEDISADFIDCQSGSSSFGYGNGLNGNFVNCKALDQSFAFGANAAGTFTNCQGGDASFGGGDATSFGTAQGTFVNCSAGIKSFGGGDNGVNLGGVSTGIFTNCTGGGIDSFGQSQNGQKKGKYYNCIGINISPLIAPVSGFAIQLNCTDLNGNIVEGFKP